MRHRLMVLVLSPIIFLIFGGCSISCYYKGPPPKFPDYRTNRMVFMDYIRNRTVLVKVRSICKTSYGVPHVINAYGTGVIKKSGLSGSYVLTARHLTHRPSVCVSSVRVVKMYENNKLKRTYGATVLVESDKDSDLALLHVSTDFKVFTSLVKNTRVGMRAHSLGFPSVLMSTSKHYWTYTDGSVSTVGILNGNADYVSFTPKIYYGNSGGGIWTDSGRLLALATDMYSSRRANYTAQYGPSVRTIEKFLKLNGYGYLLMR